MRDARLTPIGTEIDTFGVRVSNEGGRSATLGALGVYVFGGKGKLAHVGVDENGGYVTVLGGTDGEGVAGMKITEDGGSVEVYGKDGGGAVQMGITETGGSVYVHGKDGGGAVQMGITEDWRVC